MQELGLSSYSSESRDAASKASSDGQQYHALFNIFYKLIYEHIASLVEVSPQLLPRTLYYACMRLSHSSATDTFGSFCLHALPAVQEVGICI